MMENKLAIIGIAFIALLTFWVSIDGARVGREQIQTEAVKRGYGEWTADKEFRWIEPDQRIDAESEQDQ